MLSNTKICIISKNITIIKTRHLKIGNSTKQSKLKHCKISKYMSPKLYQAEYQSSKFYLSSVARTSLDDVIVSLMEWCKAMVSILIEMHVDMVNISPH